jgi:hypothetical protein
MSPLSAVAYLSTSIKPLATGDIEALLYKCRAFNSTVGVTGALLLHERTFFQYFEGPPQSVGAVYQRIKESSYHSGITELLNEPVEKRLFSDWLMGFADVPGSLVLLLEQAQWRKEIGVQRAKGSHELGLDLLLEFWGRVQV